MKKILLILLIALASLPHLSAADGDIFSFDGFLYKVLSEDDHTAEVSENRYRVGELSIPSIVTYKGTDYTVTSIGSGAYLNCSLTSVTIPSSVTSIGSAAFAGCSSLTSVTIPTSVTSIGGDAFRNCSSLTSVTIPNSVTYIGSGVFWDCSSLTSVTIPDSVTSIEGSLFMRCSSLISVIIPNSVTSIGERAFYECSNLTSVSIQNSGTSVTTPGSGKSIIGNCAFYGCSKLISVTLPNSVTEIVNYAFYGCSSLTTITLPNSVTSIGYGAFEECWSLTSITIPNSVTYISDTAFFDCSNLTEINVESGNEYFCSDNGVLYNFDKTTLIRCPETKTECDIHDSVTSIDNRAFEGCSSLTTITIPNSVTSIGYRAFSGCLNLTKIVNLNPTPQSIDYTFYDGPVTAMVYIPKGSSDSFRTADGWSQFNDFREMDANITLSPTSVELNKGELIEITASVGKYDDMTIEGEEWSSSNTEVATVDEGKVKAIAPGIAVISYIVTDGYGVAHTESCTVTVNPILAESIALDRTELVLTIGATDKLTATVLPEDVTDKTVTWTSSDDTIVKVDEEGNIQALALGEAIITAACGEQSATCKVTVNPILAESIALDRTELVLTIGATDKLTATVLPEDVTDKIVTWTSSDDTIVTVDEDGNIQALALGEAIITAACGEQSATCKVTVNPILAESIALDRTELVLTIGATDKLTATVLPEDVTDKTVTWTSSDDTIVKVDEEGNIQALALGEAIITAACGEQSATCKVTVNPILAESIALDRTELVLTIGATDKLTATVLPEDVTDKTVTWTSSDESIATVDEDGNVTAIAEGEAVITATCGEVSASCNVTVEGIVTGIVYVENDDINITVNGTELTVETSRPSAKVTIVRQDGAVIYTGENRGSYYLVRGLYIVVVDNATQKIVIN